MFKKKIFYKKKGIPYEQAEYTLTKIIQNLYPPSNRIKDKLQLYYDKNKIWRVGGRLKNSNLTSNAKNPIYLPHSHPTKLYVLYIHQRNLHSGTAHTLAQLRLNYWISKGRKYVRDTIKSKCTICQKYDSKPFALPPMPNLPESRITLNAIFKHVGLDYLGPITIKDDQQTLKKCWIALITCLTTRAVHLEVVQGLSAMEFINAF